MVKGKEKKEGGEEPLLTPEEVAEWLQVSPRSLERWRASRMGPQFRKIGSCVRYAKGDVQAWIDGQTVETNPVLV